MEKKRTLQTYEAPMLRFIDVWAERQFALSMTNGFVYDAEEQDEYWFF